MEYRVNFLIANSLALVIGAFVNIYLWNAVYNAIDSETIGPLNKKAMLFYIGCATLCSVLTRPYRKEREVAAEIRQGELNKYLTKPFSFFGFVTAFSFGERIAGWIFLCVLAIVFGIPLVSAYHLSLPLSGILLAIPFLFCGIVLNFLFTLMISYFAFWFDEVWTFQVMKDLLLWFLSGQIFPMSILPEMLQDIARFLPFQYIAFAPAALLTGQWNSAEAVIHLPIAIGYSILLVFVTHIIWKIGIRRYGAFGG